MSLLLDTTVLSELLRARPDSRVLAWLASQPSAALCVSAVTQAEMMLGQVCCLRAKGASG